MHPHWGGVIAFLIALAESIAILGLIIPGSIAMSAIGILVGSHVLPAITTMVWAMAGAFIGDISSYWFGHHYRSKIRKMWPFCKMPSWLDRGENFFASHGGKGIFIGRFIGPIRPILPLIAGTMAMPALRFHIVDFLSAILWAPAYMLPGILIGAASLALPPEAASRLIIYLVVSFIILGLLFWLFKKLFFFILHTVKRLFITIWQIIISNKNCPRFAYFFQVDPNPNDPSQLVIFTFFLLSLIAFIIITIGAVQISVFASFNMAIFHFFRSIYHPNVQHIMIAITLWFDPKVMGVLWLAVLAYFLWKKEWLNFTYWAFIGCAAIGFIGLFKHVIHSPRPFSLVHGPHSNSYLSGHVTLSAVILSFLTILLCYRRNRTTHWLAFGIVILLLLLCSMSRLYLGLHWASDVIGSYFFAITLLLAATFFYRRQLHPPISAKILLPLALFITFIAWGCVFWKDYDRMVVDYRPQQSFTTTTVTEWWQSGLRGHPLYRINRFGKPVQTMNIEWLGDINTIKQTLTQQGWKIKPNNAWLSTINYLGMKDHSKMLPLLPVVNQGRQPILTMTTLVGNPQKLLILRLWPSDVTVSDADEKIWIGTLNYQRNLKHPYHLLEYAPFLSVLPTSSVFSNYLQGYHYKTLYFPEYPPLNNNLDRDWDGHVLLICSNLFLEAAN
jgi:membrane protein DedA with SNARE-associated domain/membrane-associated phospholipid phosphatase